MAKTNIAEVVSIHIVRRRNAAAESCNHVTVRSNFGIMGDYRSERFQIGQITLVEAEIMEQVSRKLGYKIPAGASRRQVMVKGMRLNELIGRNLRMGQVLLRVEDKCTPCNNMEDKIGPGAKDAMDDRGGVRCRIIEGGELHVGEKIAVEPPRCLYSARLSSLCFRFISYLIRLSKMGG